MWKCDGGIAAAARRGELAYNFKQIQRARLTQPVIQLSKTLTKYAFLSSGV